jgi:hypothetical protein
MRPGRVQKRPMKGVKETCERGKRGLCKGEKRPTESWRVQKRPVIGVKEAYERGKRDL